MELDELKEKYVLITSEDTDVSVRILCPVIF